jgi:hypothetical protein
MDLTLPNLPLLRQEALKHLRREGSKPFTDFEAWLVGDLLGLHFDRAGDAPLVQAAHFEIDVMQLGKYEFLIAWLSPYHMASAIPQVVAEIALYLLGLAEVPNEVRQRIDRVVKRRRIS